MWAVEKCVPAHNGLAVRISMVRGSAQGRPSHSRDGARGTERRAEGEMRAVVCQSRAKLLGSGSPGESTPTLPQPGFASAARGPVTDPGLQLAK